jgi:hypothetical protein
MLPTRVEDVAVASKRCIWTRDVKAMSSAYEDTLNTLGVSARSSALKELLAKNIIDLAKRGERDPIRLREMALGATTD